MAGPADACASYAACRTRFDVWIKCHLPRLPLIPHKGRRGMTQIVEHGRRCSSTIPPHSPLSAIMETFILKARLTATMTDVWPQLPSAWFVLISFAKSRRKSRATRRIHQRPPLRMAFESNGAPGTIRTSDPQIRSLMLYPAELRARWRGAHRGVIRAWQAPIFTFANIPAKPAPKARRAGASPDQEGPAPAPRQSPRPPGRPACLARPGKCKAARHTARQLSPRS